MTTKAFAPATVANVACGFDVLGLAVDGPGDTVSARLSKEPGVGLTGIEGDDGRLPRDPVSNTATVAARALASRARRRARLNVEVAGG